MAFKKLKPLEPNVENTSKGCLHCGTLPIKLKMNQKIVQSFGGEYITKNYKIFYWPDTCDLSDQDWKKQKTLMWIENKARKSPNDDWRLIFDMPLYDAVYQRQGKNNWVLVKKGLGFA